MKILSRFLLIAGILVGLYGSFALPAIKRDAVFIYVGGALMITGAFIEFRRQWRESETRHQSLARCERAFQELTKELTDTIPTAGPEVFRHEYTENLLSAFLSRVEDHLEHFPKDHETNREFYALVHTARFLRETLMPGHGFEKIRFNS